MPRITTVAGASITYCREHLPPRETAEQRHGPILLYATPHDPGEVCAACGARMAAGEEKEIADPLRKYGQHLWGCPWGLGGGLPCNCGLVELLGE